jgi:hypothetical protein
VLEDQLAAQQNHAEQVQQALEEEIGQLLERLMRLQDEKA